MSAPELISCEQLRQMIDKLSTPQDYLIVDVRDTDFKCGNIPNCINIPSHEFMSRIEDLKSQLGPSTVPVFHCQLSQVRGPKCARRFMDSYGPTNTRPVFVLEGGFEAWKEMCGNDTMYVENIDMEFWSNQ